MSACGHRPVSTLTVTVTGKNIRPYRLWTCDACGKRDRWSETWGHYGSLWCRKCHEEPAIEWVACSDECRAALEAGKTRTPRPTKAAPPRKPTRAQVIAKLAKTNDLNAHRDEIMQLLGVSRA